MGLRSGRARVLASAVLATAVVGAVLAATGPSGAAPAAPARKLDRAALARTLLAHHRGRFATSTSRQALERAAGVAPSSSDPTGPAAAASPVAGGRPALLPRAGLPNIRVNDPAADKFRVDQTTQHNVSLAVSGRNVAVAFDDTQQELDFATAGSDFAGYAYSHDGGQTFTDGGTVPNFPGLTNGGQPWVTADRGGRMYYATLAEAFPSQNTEVLVARSDDGGQTWADPRPASPNDQSAFYHSDKEAIAAGPDPRSTGQDNVYAAWNDELVDPVANTAAEGLPVATSTDHGQTWSVHYADRITTDPASCSFAQYLGAQPFVDPADGTLYVAAEKFAIDDPNCDGGTVTRAQVVFASADGGTTFGRGVTVAKVATSHTLHLGPNMDLGMGVEYPVLAANGGVLQLAWTDGTGGRDHIRFATSKDHGATWTVTAATTGNGDEVQPAMSVDRAGIHLAYYQRNADNTLDTVVADSTDGARFTAEAITTQPFPGVATILPFDPMGDRGDMGSYIANVTDGAHQYFAWADNRDKVTNFTNPHGRNDPDIFLTRR